MRRAIAATGGTVVGLVALLSYKSSGHVNIQHVSFTPAGTAGAGQALPPPGATGASGSGGPSNTTATTVPGSAGASPPTTGVPASRSAPTTSPAARTYTGTDVQYYYGDIQVSITVRDKRLVQVNVPRNGAADGRSQMINSYAVPVLEKEALAAQSLKFDVVSGATFTSDAFAQSFQSAMQAAGL